MVVNLPRTEYQQALSMSEKAGNQIGIAISLNNIGSLYNGQRDHQQALDYHKRALTIWKEAGDQAGLAITFSNMGSAYHDMGNHQQALDYYKRALTIQKKIGRRYGESTTRNNMAMLFRDEGLLDKAVEQMRLVVQFEREVDHPDLKRDQAKLARFEAALKARQTSNTLSKKYPTKSLKHQIVHQIKRYLTRK